MSNLIKFHSTATVKGEQALRAISATPAYELLIQFLEELLKEQDKENRRLPPEDIHVGQGRSQVLEDLVDYFYEIRNQQRRSSAGATTRPVDLP